MMLVMAQKDVLIFESDSHRHGDVGMAQNPQIGEAVQLAPALNDHEARAILTALHDRVRRKRIMVANLVLQTTQDSLPPFRARSLSRMYGEKRCFVLKIPRGETQTRWVKTQ